MFKVTNKILSSGKGSMRIPVKVAAQKRFLAAVSSNSPRQMPYRHPRSTPISHEPATFTIRDGPLFHGKSFGAKTSISGEAVFTTSLVGYPESLTDPSYRAQVTNKCSHQMSSSELIEMSPLLDPGIHAAPYWKLRCPLLSCS